MMPEARSIPCGWRTAYPRHSKIHADPDTGLATVEALFAAGCVLGHRDDSLLRFYPWRDVFLALNRDVVEQAEALVETGPCRPADERFVERKQQWKKLATPVTESHSIPVVGGPWMKREQHRMEKGGVLMLPTDTRDTAKSATPNTVLHRRT